ncbi:hypothetical protein [Saccharospirillum alexandrii]|uniref:hypothetical protein n=1 Tax=Saccharospirillum alexandrii TaxID=2448477 RepID=UPI000FD79629|nr:hypothetical protein [Saccharospirillum alexandrii]
MKIQEKCKQFVKNALTSVGVDVRRTGAEAEDIAFFKDEYEALLYNQGGKKSAFPCPIEICTHQNGIGFSSSDWHPFVETIKQYRANPLLSYDESVLKLFYSRWTPSNAAEAIPGFKDSPKAFRSYPPHYLFLSPWSSLTAKEIDIDVKWWNQKDNTEHGRSDLSYPTHGWAYSGPTHHEKGKLEFDRIIRLYKNIKANGYNTQLGYIGVTQLKINSSSIYLIGGGGYHRTAVLSALGYKEIPATHHRISTVNIDDAQYWPQVRNGLWTESQAKNYVHHLFSFCSSDWAKEMQLTLDLSKQKPDIFSL